LLGKRAHRAAILANCLAHARRGFVDLLEKFPAECEYVIETLGSVYSFDAETRKLKMSDEERLRFHQINSGPLMGKLKKWMAQQLRDRKIEPNSGLGDAIQYMQNHWMKLVLFLRVAGAPLDNNICERALKKAILHRKNSLFYRTLNGARVGDTFMGLIHTAELNRVDVFHYLVTLLKNHEDTARNPGAWMPWNYQKNPVRDHHTETVAA